MALVSKQVKDLREIIMSHHRWIQAGDVIYSPETPILINPINIRDLYVNYNEQRIRLNFIEKIFIWSLVKKKMLSLRRIRRFNHKYAPV